jgi:hypothetical protein
MTEKPDYEEEIEQIAEDLREKTDFSSPLMKHLMFVGRYISWYSGHEGKPDEEDFKSFNEELTTLIGEAAEEGVHLGDVAMVLWAHLNNIEKIHRKEDDDTGESEDRTADRMFQ